MTLMKRDSTGA